MLMNSEKLKHDDNDDSYSIFGETRKNNVKLFEFHESFKIDIFFRKLVRESGSMDNLE